MATVRAHVVEVENEHFPGWVRLRLCLVSGDVVGLHEKQAVLGLTAPEVGDTVPVACEVLDRASDDAVSVRFLHGVETTTGEAVLTVVRDLIEL